MQTCEVKQLIYKSRERNFSLTWKHSVICIFNESTDEYNVKTSENDVNFSNFNRKEMDKSRELYSREGDNSIRFEGKTVA